MRIYGFGIYGAMHSGLSPAAGETVAFRNSGAMGTVGCVDGQSDVVRHGVKVVRAF